MYGPEFEKKVDAIVARYPHAKAALLRVIHRLISELQQHLPGRRPMLLQRGNTGRQRGPRVYPLQQSGALPEEVPHPPGDLERPGRAGVAQEQHELVAAVADHQVSGFADGRRQQLAED